MILTSTDLQQKAKHAAWTKKKDTGLSAQDAEAEYIKYVAKLVDEHGTK